MNGSMTLNFNPRHSDRSRPRSSPREYKNLTMSCSITADESPVSSTDCGTGGQMFWSSVVESNSRIGAVAMRKSHFADPFARLQWDHSPVELSGILRVNPEKACGPSGRLRWCSRLLCVARAPFGARKHDQCRYEPPQDNRHCVDKGAVFEGQFRTQERPGPQIDVFEQF